MEAIILITGNVKNTITLDPTLWIFDERHFEIQERFPEIEGLGMELAPFLAHAEPANDAERVTLHQKDGGLIHLTLAETQQAILQFAHHGKPISKEGPALFHFHDSKSIGSVTKIEVK
ncbi:hypothetical protein SAMN05444487_105183 [Marininema mesophilum]|uniref:Uncharacterized protein n=1 Tax=Marininema mesophilum TaxID=1048340 RepID=A0A1H2VR11_9BACL|nr:hypothetical protein [Marininema mesophilum]SDW70766.1 hypothetical protein SAMN05444487_105183 [Marininema mesophilum]